MAILNLVEIGRVVEGFMLDVILVKRKTGEAYNPTTMEVTPIYTDLYEGKAFVAPMGDPGATSLAGEDVQRIQYEIGLPTASPSFMPNDVVDVITSADPDLVSTGQFFVHDEIASTFFTHRRLKAFRDRPAI